MEVTTLLLITGIAAFTSLLFTQLFIYRKYLQSKIILNGKIAQAEEHLREDIQQIGMSELERTSSGREVLSLQGHSDSKAPEVVQHSDKNNDRFNVEWSSLGKFIARPIAIAFVPLVLLGILIGARSTFLNPSLSAAEAERIDLETRHQQEIAELQEQLALAQTELQIQALRQEQDLLLVQHKSELDIIEAKIQVRQSTMVAAILGTSIIGLVLTSLSILWSSKKVLESTLSEENNSQYIKLTKEEIREVIRMRKTGSNPSSR